MDGEEFRKRAMFDDHLLSMYLDECRKRIKEFEDGEGGWVSVPYWAGWVNQLGDFKRDDWKYRFLRIAKQEGDRYRPLWTIRLINLYAKDSLSDTLAIRRYWRDHYEAKYDKERKKAKKHWETIKKLRARIKELEDKEPS